jgi:hypothetical protein
VQNEQFVVLQAQFETAFNQLKGARDPDERLLVLRELRATLARMDDAVFDVDHPLLPMFDDVAP